MEAPLDYRHKIIDGMATGETRYPFPKPPGSFTGPIVDLEMSKLRSGLSMAHGFDISTITTTFCDALLGTAIEAFHEDMLPLPFDIVLFNFGGIVKDKSIAVCDLVVKSYHGFTIQQIIRVDNAWLIMPWATCIYTGKNLDKGGVVINKLEFASEHKLVDANLGQATHSAQRVLQSLVCLETKHVRITDEAAPENLNKAREKRGACPISGHKIVTIDTSSAVVEMSDRSGTHASPRLHWRRGHVRRLPDGNKTKVKPCLVGDPAAARVSQEWRARAHA
jgi:hypothetical protein